MESAYIIPTPVEEKKRRILYQQINSTIQRLYEVYMYKRKTDIEELKESFKSINEEDSSLVKVVFKARFGIKSDSFDLRPERVVDAILLLKKYDLPLSILEYNPTILEYRMDTLEDRIEYLLSKELDVRKILEEEPKILTTSPDRIKTNIEYLEKKGIELKRSVERFPRIIRYRPETLRERVENIESLGFNLRSIVGRHPEILKFNPTLLRRKISVLRQMRIKNESIERHPHVLERSVESWMDVVRV
ncbi:MAG: hypothetical protein J7K98_02670, partial [Candidatus Aenigmarchaeota archaeon]|nr:hypothetical protein [Candidatus Aenigmarchaeota archaeon]